MRFYILAAILFFSNIQFIGAQCDPADFPDVICISEIRVDEGPDDIEDFVTLCNNGDVPYELDAVMIVDSNPNNEITISVTIPPQSCIRIFTDDDLDFGLNGSDDSFTITCMDGSVLAEVDYPDENGDGVLDNGLLDPDIFGFCDVPMGCTGADFSSLSITGVNNDDDFVVICNSSCDDVILTGATVFDDDGIDEGEVLIGAIVPGGGCLTLFRDEDLTEDFTFGLGGNDEFTIDCGGTTITAAWDTDEDQVITDETLGPCDPAVADAIFILEVNNISGAPDEVTICNNSADLVSLDGATVSDGDNVTDLFALTIAPFGCITLIQDIHFDFGIGGGDDEFIISCEGTDYDVVPLNDGNFMDASVVAPIKPVEQIPTMGEWGLMFLTLLFLIIGVVRMKEENTVIA